VIPCVGLSEPCLKPTAQAQGGLWGVGYSNRRILGRPTALYKPGWASLAMASYLVPPVTGS
jgi:hypothetical protein